MHRWILSAIVVLVAACVGSAQPPIVELKVKPQKSAFAGSAWNKPIVIKSAKDAAKHFDKDALDVIAKKVDFEEQVVLVFAWKGSGQDKLNYEILESFPEQVPFSRRPGLTRDLRPHSRVFALRSNVRWSIKGK